jgi:hypothetical protein
VTSFTLLRSRPKWHKDTDNYNGLALVGGLFDPRLDQLHVALDNGAQPSPIPDRLQREVGAAAVALARDAALLVYGHRARRRGGRRRELRRRKMLRNPARLEVPSVRRESSVMTASARRVFSNAHAYHINSVSVNSDGETFLSADDLRINLWNLDISDQSYNIVDIKPNNMEELAEVITAAEFHPSHCNILLYSSSRGSIRLSDMRARALATRKARRSKSRSSHRASRSSPRSSPRSRT